LKTSSLPPSIVREAPGPGLEDRPLRGELGSAARHNNWLVFESAPYRTNGGVYDGNIETDIAPFRHTTHSPLVGKADRRPPAGLLANALFLSGMFVAVYFGS
jgi:hypothetical protein